MSTIQVASLANVAIPSTKGASPATTPEKMSQSAADGRPDHLFTEILSAHTSRSKGSPKKVELPSPPDKHPQKKDKGKTSISAGSLSLAASDEVPIRTDGPPPAKAEAKAAPQNPIPPVAEAIPQAREDKGRAVSNNGAITIPVDMRNESPQQSEHNTWSKAVLVGAKDSRSAAAKPPVPTTPLVSMTSNENVARPSSASEHSPALGLSSEVSGKSSPLLAEPSPSQGDGKPKAGVGVTLVTQPGPANPKAEKVPKSQSQSPDPPALEVITATSGFSTKVTPPKLAATNSVSAPPTSPVNLKYLSEVISRPLSNGNGTYTVVIALHPSELGQLQAVVSLERDELRVFITPQTQAGHTAMSTNVDALKTQLAQGGMSVNVTLRDPGSHARGDAWPEPDRIRSEPAASKDPLFASSITPEPDPGQIHLML